MEFKVQRAGINGTWKTVCENRNESYAREIYLKQLELYSIGQFRLVDPNGTVLAQAKATPLFSKN